MITTTATWLGGELSTEVIGWLIHMFKLEAGCWLLILADGPSLAAGLSMRAGIAVNVVLGRLDLDEKIPNLKEKLLNEVNKYSALLKDNDMVDIPDYVQGQSHSRHHGGCQGFRDHPWDCATIPVATALNEQILGHHPLDTGNVQSKNEDDMDEDAEPQGTADAPATPHCGFQSSGRVRRGESLSLTSMLGGGDAERICTHFLYTSGAF